MGLIDRIVWNRHTRSWVLWALQHRPLSKGRVMCVAWNGMQYNCNPRAIARQLAVHADFEVWFAFLHPEQFQGMADDAVHVVELGSKRYFELLATSQFVISNVRFAGGIYWPFPKKPGQYYIQTMHGGHGIKKIEWDVEEMLTPAYIAAAEKDRKATDLMISDSDYWSHIYRTAFRYDGEILEHGLPRNDVFFRNPSARSAEKQYLIYTPTFRGNGRRDVYGFDVDRVVAALEQRFGGEWYVRISSHPNMRDYYREIYDFSHPRMIDVGNEDLQPLLLTSDALITDYSSAEMDFSLTGRPVFQLCRDREDYDRGFYINPEDLPFPYATNDDGLVQNILAFDADKYAREVDAFNRDVIGLKETGHAAEGVVEWMLGKM